MQRTRGKRKRTPKRLKERKLGRAMCLILMPRSTKMPIQKQPPKELSKRLEKTTLANLLPTPKSQDPPESKAKRVVNRL